MKPINPEIRQKIIDAAEFLVSQGEKTTNEAVREQLGGSTSFSHISPVMREWREKQEQSVSVALEMPDIIKTASDRFVTEMWKAANGEARKKVDAIQTASDERIAVVESELSEALKEIEVLEKTGNDLTTEKTALNTLLEEQKELFTKSEVQNQSLLITYEKEKIRTETALARLDENKKALNKMQEQNEKLQNELILLAKETAKLAKRK